MKNRFNKLSYTLIFLIPMVLSFSIYILDFATKNCPAHHTFTHFKRCPECKASDANYVECPKQSHVNNNTVDCIYPRACRFLLIINYITFICLTILVLIFFSYKLYCYKFKDKTPIL